MKNLFGNNRSKMSFLKKTSMLEIYLDNFLAEIPQEHVSINVLLVLLVAHENTVTLLEKKCHFVATLL